MSYPYLFNRAYALCIKANSHAIAHDLAYMTETELMGESIFYRRLLAD